MSSCTESIMEETKGLGNRDVKGTTNYCFVFESWFASKRSAEAVMGVGEDMIGMVKTKKWDYLMIPSRI